MQRKFLTNLSLLLLLNFLIKPIWIFGIDLKVQNVVGAEEYGFYFAIINASFLFNILLDFGITKFNNKNIAQNNHLLNKHFSGIVILKLLLAVVYVIFTISFGLIVGYNGAQMKLLAIVGINQFLLSFILYLRSNISGLLMFKTDSFLSVFDRFLMILICGVLLYTNITDHVFKIEWFVYAQTAAYLLAAIVSFIIVVFKAEFKRLKWNWPFSLMILRESFPFAILILLMTFYNRIDSVMIERLLPDSKGELQSGVYAMSYRLLDAVNQVPYLFSVLLFPIFARMIKQKQEIQQMVKLSFSLLFIVFIIVASGSFFYNVQIIGALYVENIDEAARVFSVLMLCFIPVSIIYVFGTLLTANGNLRTLNLIAAGGMALNIILNFILIPQMEAMGSAIASISTQFMSGLLLVYFVQRIFKFKINRKFLGTLFFFIIGVIIFNIVTVDLNLNWTLNFVIMIVLSLVLASSLRLLNIKSLINIIANNRS